MLHTSHVCMDFTCIEIKTELWIIFSSFLKSDSMLPQQKYTVIAHLSGRSLELFERPP